MKRLLMLLIFLGTCIWAVSAIEAGFTLGTFSGGSNFNLAPDGTFVKTGFIAGISPRIEVESSIIGEITPNLYQTILLKSSFSYALLSPIYYLGDKDPLYLNMWISLGMIHSLPFSDSYGPFITFTPLTSGGSQFLRKERVASLSLYYDIPSRKVGFFFELFTLDFFFS